MSEVLFSKWRHCPHVSTTPSPWGQRMCACIYQVPTVCTVQCAILTMHLCILYFIRHYSTICFGRTK